ncbi:DUF6274 family protein [Streptomyces spectabilis]|uniref:Uncharacterized protein n=1 Tax=Streptomyces spectabilis TaxID=68270 RepID=A0A516R9N9_STRST|nr:DUF6274 family protein [Streptomyces spectabilis]QDQ12378.1 hypothetical protein FH965_18915 [Streptomyces spectabilis]
MTPVPAPARHETRALLRAHLAAASSYRHLTRHCPICHRLLRLAMEPADDAHEATEAPGATERRTGQREDESPPKA